MTTKPSIGKRLLGVMLAVPMALAGMGIGATTAVAADTVPTDNLIAAYDFTTKPSDGQDRGQQCAERYAWRGRSAELRRLALGR